MNTLMELELARQQVAEESRRMISTIRAQSSVDNSEVVSNLVESNNSSPPRSAEVVLLEERLGRLEKELATKIEVGNQNEELKQEAQALRAEREQHAEDKRRLEERIQMLELVP